MSSLLRDLFDATSRPPAGERLRAVTDAEIDAAIAASGPPPCDDADCACGGEGLAYHPRRREAR